MAKKESPIVSFPCSTNVSLREEMEIVSVNCRTLAMVFHGAWWVSVKHLGGATQTFYFDIETEGYEDHAKDIYKKLCKGMAKWGIPVVGEEDMGDEN